MKRLILVVVVLLGAGLSIWWLSGGLDRSVADRVEDELAARGLSQPMAECMAGRMTERLSIAQLRELERLGPEEGEADIPLTVADLLDRLRRIDDRELLEVTAGSAAVCAFSGG